MQYTIQYNTIQYNAIYNTIQLVVQHDEYDTIDTLLNGVLGAFPSSSPTTNQAKRLDHTGSDPISRCAWAFPHSESTEQKSTHFDSW